MAKNHKRGSVELRWQRLVAVIGLVTCIAGLTVGYVLQRRAHDELGQQIDAVESQIDWVTNQVRRGREQVERCRKKNVLMDRAAQMGLGLSDIVSSQRITIPLLESPAAVQSLAPAGVLRTIPLAAASATVFPQ